MKQCEQCGAIYPNRELHICGQNALVDISRLREQNKELRKRVAVLEMMLDKANGVMESDSG